MKDTSTNDSRLAEAHVPETEFGKWFLRTATWTNYVLEVALTDLTRLLADEMNTFDIIADVGVGYGRSLVKLHERFSPKKLIAIDIEQEMLDATRQEIKEKQIAPVEFIKCSNSQLKLPDNSVDMLFCHQTFHHLIYQEVAIKEYFRVLKPGGVLLFAESTKRYIHSWIIRLLFRHPMKVQKTAEEYLELIRSAGFDLPDDKVSYPFLWWSREDLGILENWFGIKPKQPQEQTLINLVAKKPK